ncbi:Hypothetical predicted protein [Paramuricea clavata]|uniref:Uncharacterized protein n=1 Tax=Paramuricea clavata TaxID=317549 RepID=A0A7D9K3V9_PARCT|nr:Hypothetical predicted protein [Paramuricea clavata]
MQNSESSFTQGYRVSLLRRISTNDKGKLIWADSLESLKLFVEEVLNIANGIWICPGGEAKQFKNKDLDIRWYPTTKSITVSGNLENEIKEKLHSLAFISKQLQVNAENNEEAPDHDDHNDTNRSFVNDDPPISQELLQELSSESPTNIAAKSFIDHSTSDNVAADKNTNIEHEKQGEAILHTESTNQHKSTMKSLNGNVPNMPTNRHKVSNECGEHVNTTNPPRDTYNKYKWDSEISVLKAKFERFAQSVTNKLEDISFEVNNIKENKPYSILVLENAVNDLKQEKHELNKKNDDLRELNVTMSHTISDLRLANKNLESEKASLLTALKLIQGDCTRMTETAHVGEKTTKPNKCNSANYPNDHIEQTCPREVADCTKQIAQSK